MTYRYARWLHVCTFVDLQYNDISLTFTAGSVRCVQSCGCPWSVCEVVFVPYVVSAVTVICVLWVMCLTTCGVEN